MGDNGIVDLDWTTISYHRTIAHLVRILIAESVKALFKYADVSSYVITLLTQIKWHTMQVMQDKDRCVNNIFKIVKLNM